MSNSARFPKTIEELNNHFNIAIPYITNPINKTRLGITDAKLKIVTDFKVSFDANKQLYNDKTTKTSIVNSNNVTLINALETELKSIYNNIPYSSLTAIDRETLLIFKPLHDNAIPVADYSPNILVEKSGYLLMNLAF